jgi:hypothetical protein
MRDKYSVIVWEDKWIKDIFPVGSETGSYLTNFFPVVYDACLKLGLKVLHTKCAYSLLCTYCKKMCIHHQFL